MIRRAFQIVVYGPSHKRQFPRHDDTPCVWMAWGNARFAKLALLAATRAVPCEPEWEIICSDCRNAARPVVTIRPEAGCWRYGYPFGKRATPYGYARQSRRMPAAGFQEAPGQARVWYPSEDWHRRANWSYPPRAHTHARVDA